MKQTTAIPSSPYEAMTIVSPMVFGEEPKDQDRARFFGPGPVGCVCDGVTSSPRSTEAAELVTSLAPALFQGNMHERLAMACDLLMGLRSQFQATCASIPDDKPAAMQTMLRQVLQQKKAISYQTTMLAARLRPGESEVIVDLLRCGDSAFFAFSGDGELLSSSLARPSGRVDAQPCQFRGQTLRFGPGDQILIRVEGRLDEHDNLATNAGIPERYRHNWVVCSPVDVGSGPRARILGPQTMVVGPDDRLLVPRYLHGHQLESQGHEYRFMDYSSTIRVVSTSPSDGPADGIEHRGSATAVLPDHVYAGHYDCIEDRFPCGTHFVLCSDGFYSAFSTASELWAWIQEDPDTLGDVRQRDPKLTDLHHRLHERGGDDDMAFVWIYPATPAAPETSRSEDDRKGADHAQ